ncbi:MAG: gamma-glutamylcyclotransferase [Deltaproteobacteria bacterium]|nr:gamma-glutamylcyclotransferase [Deltaproteobacteria bacterium]
MPSSTKRSKRRDAPTILFVYGTLKRGQRNHFLMREARFLGEAVTAPLYTLLNLGPFPGMVPGGTTAVHGELYEVGRELLARLDRHEGVPRLYIRGVVWLENRAWAESYLLVDFDRIRMGRASESGEWSSTLKEI